MKNIMQRNLSNITLADDQRETMKRKLEDVFETMLSVMYFDATNPHLKDTPKRMANMYVDELFVGCYTDPPKITKFPNDKDSGMIFIGNIDVFSVCSHHFKSFTGKAHVAYVPKDNIIGISKFARIVDWFARRPQVQENLTNDIADFLYDYIQPIGIGISIRAVHDCMRVRGVQQCNSEMITTSLRGDFLTNKTMVQEFYDNIKRVE